MDNDKCVLDISSDEETDVKDQQVNLEWFCDQLFKGVDDSDDVVVVGEVLGSKKVEGKCLSSSDKKGREEEDDDDCVVLDGDPDKMVSVDEKQNDGSDELFVVGEKGQVACRDYPHPRHLCVKYPFSSTLHTFHCEQCHCYVCDSVAPCNLWGSGMSIDDHCHATDRQEVWKTERKNFKLKRCPSLPALKKSENPSSSVPYTISTKIPNQPHPLSRSITMPSNHFPSRCTPSIPTAFRHVPSDSAVRPQPSAPNLITPNIMNPRSGSYKLPHSAITQQLPGVYTKYVGQRVRYQNTMDLGPQSFPLKRARTGVAYQAASLMGYGHLHSSISSYAPSSTRSRPVGGESVSRMNNPHQWINPGSNMNNGTFHKPLPQSHYTNRPHTGAVYQGGMSNQSASVGTQSVNQQVSYPSVMIPDVSIPEVDTTDSFSRQWDQPLQSDSNMLSDKINTNSRQWDQPDPTEVSSTRTPTPITVTWEENSNSSQSEQHLETSTLEVQVPQPVNPAPNYLHTEHSEKGELPAPGSDGQASAVPEFEDWLMENQSAVGKPSEPLFFYDQNILSPDDAHVDLDLLEWNFLANVDDEM